MGLRSDAEAGSRSPLPSMFIPAGLDAPFMSMSASTKASMSSSCVWDWPGSGSDEGCDASSSAMLSKRNATDINPKRGM